MKKEKMNLESLKVRSFITVINGSEVITFKGGRHTDNPQDCPFPSFENKCDPTTSVSVPQTHTCPEPGTTTPPGNNSYPCTSPNYGCEGVGG